MARYDLYRLLSVEMQHFESKSVFLILYADDQAPIFRKES
jgi:hypothetical protein